MWAQTVPVDSVSHFFPFPFPFPFPSPLPAPEAIIRMDTVWGGTKERRGSWIQWAGTLVMAAEVVGGVDGAVVVGTLVVVGRLVGGVDGAVVVGTLVLVGRLVGENERRTCRVGTT